MKIRGLFLLRRYPIPALILSLLLVALILMSLRVKQQKGIAFLDALFLEATAPFQKATTFVAQTVQGIIQQYLFLVHLQKENALLKQRVAELQMENHLKEEALQANERLRKLLDFRAGVPSAMVAAEVIGQDPSGWFRSVTINKGERDGIQRGMAVISSEGVIGQVLKAAPRYATVLLLTDYNSAIDAIVQKTRARAIVEGKGENLCRLKYLLRTEEVQIGDVIITSGLGGNFPKGLVIGTVMKVEKKGHGIFQYAELAPGVDLSRLEEVLVITESPVPTEEDRGKKPKKPPGGGAKGK
jgi:rod shape-determining protein MreC